MIETIETFGPFVTYLQGFVATSLPAPEAVTTLADWRALRSAELNQTAMK
jgi:hypothetical protein